MYETVNDAINGTGAIADIPDDEIYRLGYRIKYFGDYIPDPAKRTRLLEMRERLAQIDAQRKAELKARRQGSNAKMCDCGHVSAFPMMAAHGTTCADCYDRMSD
jgi:hypothetical protein